MSKVTKEGAAYIKALLEVGNFHFVGEDSFIRANKDRELVTIKSVRGESLPLALISDKTPPGDYGILMPFSEPIGHTAERKFFYSAISCGVGLMIKGMVREIFTRAVDVKDEDGRKEIGDVKLMAEVVDEADAKSSGEINSIKAHEFGSIMFNKKRKRATLECKINKHKYFQEFKDRGIRVKTIRAINRVIESLLDSENIERDYVYEVEDNKIVSTKTQLGVFTKIVTTTADALGVLIGVEVDAEEFDKNFARLDEFASALRHHSPTTIKKEVNDEVKAETPKTPRKPWETAPTQSNTRPWETPQQPIAGSGGSIASMIEQRRRYGAQGQPQPQVTPSGYPLPGATNSQAIPPRSSNPYHDIHRRAHERHMNSQSIQPQQHQPGAYNRY